MSKRLTLSNCSWQKDESDIDHPLNDNTSVTIKSSKRTKSCTKGEIIDPDRRWETTTDINEVSYNFAMLTFYLKM